MKNLLKTSDDKVFDVINYIVLTITFLIVVYPIYFIIIASVSNPDAVNSGQTLLIPKGFTLEGYITIIGESSIWTGYKNTIIYTVAGTLLNLALTLTSGYALSRKELYGRNMFMAILTFTMFFNGGLIPNYLLLKKLGIINNIWVMIIPGAVSVWNIIVTRTFFQASIPEELLEAAVIDGCSRLKFFIKIVLPLSGAIIAVMTIFYAVGHWNEFFRALIYLRNKSLYPLQLVLREILIRNQVDMEMIMDSEFVQKQNRLVELMRYGIIIIASLPVLVLYPFLQNYFVKGIMIGAIKG